MKQIAGQEKYLKVGLMMFSFCLAILDNPITCWRIFVQERLGVEVSLVGVTSSKKMLLEPNGLSLDSWQDQFSNSASAADMQAFSDAISEVEADAVVFDCTASDVPGKFYPQLLGQGVHVITPNKKLHSGPLEDYLAVRALQAQGKAHYFYEVRAVLFFNCCWPNAHQLDLQIIPKLPSCLCF